MAKTPETKGRERALKAWKTRRKLSSRTKARASEAASKEAFRAHYESKGWRVAFFEGSTGAPRTGIIDAVAFRLARQNADALELRLVQLKGGQAGISGGEIGRLKKASQAVIVGWTIAAFDGEALHLLPEDPGPVKRR